MVFFYFKIPKSKPKEKYSILGGGCSRQQIWKNTYFSLKQGGLFRGGEGAVRLIFTLSLSCSRDLHFTTLPYPAYPPLTLTHKHSFTHLQHIIANHFFGHSIGNPFFWIKKKYTKLHVTTLPYPAHTPSQPSNHPPPPHTHTHIDTVTV